MCETEFQIARGFANWRFASVGRWLSYLSHKDRRGKLLLEETGFDAAFDALEVEVKAFAICEIGKNHSLQCDPHDDLLMHFVLVGEGNLECEHGCYDLRPGVVSIIPRQLRKSLNGPGPVHHSCAAEPNCDPRNGILRFVATHDRADLLLGCAVLETALETRFGNMARPLVVRATEPSVRALFSAMLHEVKDPRPGTRAFLSAVMKQLLIVMLRSEGPEGRHVVAPWTVEPRLKRVADLVCERPGARHSVGTMAADAAMSRSRFSQRFAAAYGCPPMVFVQSVRLAAAARLLKASALPVKAVAAAVGYASRSQFSNAFQEKHGISPSDYRQGVRPSCK